MLKRLKITYGEQQIFAHPLTVEFLNKTDVVKIEDSKDQDDPQLSINNFNSIFKKNLLREWNRLTSDDLLKRLNKFIPTQDTKEDPIDNSWLSEVILLKALAYEKSLLRNQEKLAQAYFEGRAGKFYSILVANNLAVLKAKENKCSEALKYLKDAIDECFATNFFVKAPFYNYVLVITHLDKMGFLSDTTTNYLDEILEQIDEKENRDSPPADPENPLSAYDRCYEIVRFIRDQRLNPSKRFRDLGDKDLEDSVFYEIKFVYLLTEIDTLMSFGDESESKSYINFTEKMSKANEFVKAREFESAIEFIKYSISSDYLLLSRSSVLEEIAEKRIREIEELWRANIDDEIKQLFLEGELNREKFNDALSILNNVTEKAIGLGMQRDIERLKSQIQMMKYAEEINNIEKLKNEGNYKEAENICEELLQDSELSDSLNRKISTYLVELREILND